MNKRLNERQKELLKKERQKIKNNFLCFPMSEECLTIKENFWSKRDKKEKLKLV